MVTITSGQTPFYTDLELTMPLYKMQDYTSSDIEKQQKHIRLKTGDNEAF